MKVLLIGGEACSRCRFLEPHLKARAEKNGYEFLEKDVKNATPEELEGASSLPVIWIGDKQIDYDDATAMLSNQ